MSWTQVSRPYRRYEDLPWLNDEEAKSTPKSFPVSIWEVTAEHPNGHQVVDSQEFDPEFVSTPAKLRIITAPLDNSEPDVAPGIIKLCKALQIPGDFLNERVQHVCHSFGTRMEAEHDGDASDGGFTSWFHYLCKAVEPQHDISYRWYKAGYFLRKHGVKQGGGVTLVIFGPLPPVEERLQDFMDKPCWQDVLIEPFALFQLILEGLFLLTDKSVWGMVDIIDKLEHKILNRSPSNYREKVTEQIDFEELHDWTLHLINLGEAVESCLMLVEDMISTLHRQEQQRERQMQIDQHLLQEGHTHDLKWPEAPKDHSTDEADTNTSSHHHRLPRPSPSITTLRPLTRNPTTLTISNTIYHKPVSPHTLLRDNLYYIRSLFRNTRLRLTSLQKRVDNTTNLAFHLVTQQDSRLMVRDSASMTVISFLTVLFLPTVSIATVVGSEIFQTEYPAKESVVEAEVYTSPLANTLLYTAIPITLVVTLITVGYRMWVVAESKPKVKKRVHEMKNGVKEKRKGWWQQVKEDLQQDWEVAVDISRQGWLGKGLRKLRRLLWQQPEQTSSSLAREEEGSPLPPTHPIPCPTQYVPRGQPAVPPAPMNPSGFQSMYIAQDSPTVPPPPPQQHPFSPPASQPAYNLPAPTGVSPPLQPLPPDQPADISPEPQQGDSGSHSRWNSLHARIRQGSLGSLASTLGESAVDGNRELHSRSNTRTRMPGLRTRWTS